MTDFMRQGPPERARKQNGPESRRHADQRQSIDINRVDLAADMRHPDMRHGGVARLQGPVQPPQHWVVSVRTLYDGIRMLVEHDDEIGCWMRRGSAG